MSTDNKRSDEEFMAAARVELERGARDIDELTAARLRAMRARAVNATDRPVYWPGWLQPAGVLTVLALVAGWALLAQRPTLPEADAYEVLGAGHVHDLVDGPEFYEWLDAQYETGEAPELDAI